MRPVNPHRVERDRDGVGFFAGRAAGAPDTDLFRAVTARGARSDQRRHDVLAKEAELRGVAKEAGLGDRDEVEQMAQIFLDQRGNRAAQALEILVLVDEAEQLHPGGDR